MPDELERRRTGRHRTYKGAKIILNNNQSVIDCVVRSESSDGVRLKVASIVGVPDEFPLKIMDQPGTAMSCGLEVGD